jgi:hypothetical protein
VAKLLAGIREEPLSPGIAGAVALDRDHDQGGIDWNRRSDTHQRGHLIDRALRIAHHIFIIEDERLHARVPKDVIPQLFLSLQRFQAAAIRCSL